jgi:predicted Co/Zn/Cd cation transporter (cation efflux family)
MPTEQSVLRLSIIAAVFQAALGIAFGLLAGSQSIIFDGFYGLVDATMTVLALLIAKLIAASAERGEHNRKLVERFTMGFWHLEPMVLGLNSMLLVGAAIYALLNSARSLMAGGNVIALDYAIVYALISLAAAASMGTYATFANRKIGSALIALDAKAWWITVAMTCALLMAFVFGYAVNGTRLDWVAPYIDPLVLIVVCIGVIPVPLKVIRHALQDILLVTPADLKQHVDQVAQDTVQRHGFDSFRAYVARVGRGRQIELFFIVPTQWPAKRLEEWDAIRNEVGEALGEESTDRWLTIVFTTDPEWAE